MAENNESISAIPEEISRKMEILSGYRGKDVIDNLSIKELQDIYSISESLVQDLTNGYEGRFPSDMVERYKNISKYCSINLRKQGVKDIIPDPDITLNPEYLDAKFEQKLRLFNSLAKNNPLNYNARNLPEGLVSNDGFSLLTVNIIEELEKTLKKRWEDQSFVPGDTFYEQTYKNVIEQAIKFAEGPDAPRYLKVFLGEVPRLSMIEKTFSEDSADPARSIMRVNLDIDKISNEHTTEQQRNINPETLIYHIRRNHTDSDSPSLSNDVFDKDGNPTARIAELKILNEAVKDNPSILPREYQGELDDLIKKVKEYEENLKDSPEKKAAYDKVEELVRQQDIMFDNTDRNKKLLEESILERGYSPNNKGEWIPNLDCEENSIKIIAQWEKKFQEKLLELGAAEYRSFEKIKKRSKNEIDMTNSSLFTTSMVLKDEYDHPNTVLFNVSRLTGAMEFTGNGLGAKESYEIAALNARKNNWKTVTLQYNGEPKQGVQFMENSIMALVNTGGYSFDDIRVPKKYANVLQKLREQSFIMSEAPQPGTEQDYITGGEYTAENEQEIKAANERTGQEVEEEPASVENSNEEPSNSTEEGPQEPDQGVEEEGLSANQPDSGLEDGFSSDDPDFGIEMEERAQLDAHYDAQEAMHIEEIEGYDNFPEEAMERDLSNDDPLSLNPHERSGYRAKRAKK